MNVEVRISDNIKGKGLYATKKIEKGSIIFEEDPLVSCQFPWNALYGYNACNHCLKPLETAQENARRLTGIQSLELPYPECCTTEKSKIVSCSQCGVNYCSEKCQGLAYNQYHRLLCLQIMDRSGIHPLEMLEETWKNVHYPPESNTVMLIVRLLARILQSPNPDEAIQQTLQFCHRTVNEDSELAHKLLGPKFEGMLSHLHHSFVNAIPNHECIRQFLTMDGFQSLLALIGTNGQGVGTSPISQWFNKATNMGLPDAEQELLDKFIDKMYEDIDKHTGNFLNNEGVALYMLQSTANHCCIPNAEPTFLHNNHRLSLIALKDIEPNEEICISYLDECTLERSRHSRRKELMENYIFACNCQKCESQANDPDVTSEEEEDEKSSSSSFIEDMSN
ncbi:unnamed protein product [Brassicogethes aeneus]|uniref:Protein-lysine N-trimethyltransferase SMYD5 n=1 Tax=Brassicogethes aeneus TaxID=1431903 RepID=A0A9P0B2P4_BRAAE|nr:unnamed protein product [Brassicogethes aeneus]